ncbi:hypothetical protein CFC35_35790 [Streptomyces sp. FBKL.4005]|nr:hypothetical protein CFC35_35790 [Streptomyces sp. FBKL.4005]
MLLGRWQMRTALRQAEASHQTALEVADANYRIALEAAEASHRNALEVARRQAEAERVRWLTEARRAEYRLLENSLAQFRRTLMVPEPIAEDVQSAFDEVHESVNLIEAVGPEEVCRIAVRILGKCRMPTLDITFGRFPSLEDREHWWAQIRTLRHDFHDAVKGVLEGPWG